MPADADKSSCTNSMLTLLADTINAVCLTRLTMFNSSGGRSLTSNLHISWRSSLPCPTKPELCWRTAAIPVAADVVLMLLVLLLHQVETHVIMTVCVGVPADVVAQHLNYCS
jgi:hypothetical protein